MILPIAATNGKLSTVIANATESVAIKDLLFRGYTKLVLLNPTANTIYLDIGVAATAATSYPVAQNASVTIELKNIEDVNLIASLATNAVGYFTK